MRTLIFENRLHGVALSNRKNKPLWSPGSDKYLQSCFLDPAQFCLCVEQKGRKKSEIEKEKRVKFMRVKSPF